MAELNNRSTAHASKTTIDYFENFLIEQRIIGSVTADLSMELFGRKFNTPIIMPAFSHLDKHGNPDRNGMLDYAQAATALGAVNFVGMRENPDMDELFEACKDTIRIIKPYADHDKVLDQIVYAKEHGAFAVGMDIDHVFGADGEYDVCEGELMGSQTKEMISEYVELAAPLPFVIKGVLSVQDALLCRECGVAAILVSHHAGRMPYAIPPLMVLSKIREAVGDEMKIFVDCGIARGADVFKCLALGADAAAVGKAMLPDLMKDGPDGVIRYVNKMNEELKYLMNNTGCRTLADIDSSLIWKLD